MSLKKNVLDLVQTTLSALSSDSVESLGDTEESLSVAYIVRDTYEELATYTHIPQFEKLGQLNASNDPNNPVRMEVPDGVTDIARVRYKVIDPQTGEFRLVPVDMMDRDEFLEASIMMVEGTDVGTYTLENGVELKFKNNRHPTCWTTFDDKTILFDSYDSGVETTLNNNNTYVQMYSIPPFELDDDFIPPLPEKLYPTFLANIKETAFRELKQVTSKIQKRKGDRGLATFASVGSTTDGIDGRKRNNGRKIAARRRRR